MSHTFYSIGLNTIAELTHIEPKHAESAIGYLATILRSNLKDDKVFHSLEEEIKLCENYIKLEKWRLGDKISTSIEIDPKSKTAIIPKLLIQPLIENAIRHGVAPFIHGGKVEVSSSSEGKTLTINIHNTTSSKNSVSDSDLEHKNKGHGIAVNNTRERPFCDL